MNQQKNGFALIIAPFTGEQPISINISQASVKVALVVLVSIVLTIFVGVHNIINYKTKVADYDRVVNENQVLQEQVLEFAAITEQLQQQVAEMKNFDSSIRDMLEIDTQSAGATVADPQLQLPEETSSIPVTSASIMALDSNRYLLGNRSTLTRTLSELQGNLQTLEQEVPVQSNSLENLEEEVIIYTKTLAATPDIWPAKGIITSYYGYRRSPFGTGYDFHNGIDIGIGYNTPVKATAPGVVVQRRYIYGYGYYIIVDHGMGFSTLYAHLNKFNVKIGDKVDKGQVIAYSGNSGNSTGPHLHYEVRINDRSQNPTKYLPK